MSFMSQSDSEFVSSDGAQDNANTVSSATRQIAISELNKMEQGEFVRIVGPVFEHSPWIAEAAWNRRPFTSASNLHGTLCEVVKKSGEEKQLALIRAHPDLVGRAALAGTLTRESTGEQASAGLNRLSPEEIALFQKQNTAY